MSALTESTTLDLTPEEIVDLRGVLNGADVWGYANAKHLRSIQKKRPELIRIVKAHERPPGHCRQPYFGCIATAAGRKYLRNLSKGGAA